MDGKTEPETVYGYCTPSFQDRIGENAPITYAHMMELKPSSADIEALNEKIARNEIRKALTSLFDEPIPITEPLRLPHLLIKKREYLKSVNIEHAKFTYSYLGRARVRYAKQRERLPPRIENFKPKQGYRYEFSYYCSLTLRKVTRIIKSTRKRSRITPRTEYTDRLGYKQVNEMILERVIRINKENGKVGVVYQLPLKEEYQPTQDETRFTVTRAHHKKVKVVDYTKLARADRRISKAWFNQLLDAIAKESPNNLNPTLRKIYHKVVVYQDVNPQLKEKVALT